MRLCDVTLRTTPRPSDDGLTVEQRVEAGRALDRLGVPLIGTGRPAAGAAERETTERLAADLSADVVPRCRATVDDVAAALAADPDAVEVLIPVSDARLEHRLGCSRDEAFDRASEAVLRAREGGVDVHLALVDAFRAEVPAVAGAFGRFDCSIVLADTVGARTPPFVAGFLRTLADASADLTRAGVRFRDDLGCATANALVAAETGIDRVDASVGGIGGRAGHAATEEVVAATETRGADAGVTAAETVSACRDVLRAVGASVGERKAVVGEAATALAVLDGTELDDPAAFEPFDPGAFGGRRRFVFGSQTDPEAARELLRRVDREPTADAVERLLERLTEAGPLERETALGLAEEV